MKFFIRTIFVFFLLLFSFSVVSQSGQQPELKPTAENFNSLLAIKKATSQQIESVIQLSIAYSYINQDSSIALGEHSVQISRNHPDKSLHAKALLELGDTYRIFGEREKGEKLILEGKAMYVELQNEGQVAYANNKLGAVSLDKSDYESALRFFLSALETWEKLKDSSNLVNPCINIGHVFWILKRYDKADEYNEKAMKLAEIRQEDRPLMYILNNQSLNYKATAEDFMSRADSLPRNAHTLRDSAMIFYKLSLNKLGKARLIADKLNDKQSVIRALINTANIQGALGNHTEALDINREAELLSNALGDPILIILTKRNLAEAFRHAGRLKMAAKYGEEALELAMEKQLEGHRQGVTNQLYLTYKELGLYDKALAAHESLMDFVKKSSNLDRNKAIAEVEAKYQNARNESQILEQKNNILELETAKSNVEKQRNLYIGGSVFAAALAFFGFQINRVRRERNDKRAFAEALIYAQEEERKRIARDLHDGVGQSLLLLIKQLNSTDATVSENQRLLGETLEEVRTISRDLHPFQLEKFGLTAVISDTIQKIAASTDLFVTKEMDNIDQQLPEKAEIHLFRTIQEALSNIVKHAEATAARVTVRSLPQTVSVKIQDNGKGFDYEMKMVKSKSLGLHTMFERIAAIGGKLRIEKGDPAGTMVLISIPKSEP